MKALPEEDQCTQIVKEAEIVIAAAKKLLQGSSIRKGSRLLRVVSVLADASKLSVTLQNELRPLKLAVATAEQWLSAHTGILKNLGIQCDLSQVDIEAAARSSILVGDGDDEDVVNTGTSVANDVIEAGDAIVALNELNQAIQSAESVVLEFPELKALRQRFNRVNQWRTQVKERTAVSAIVKPKPSSAVHVQELLDEGRGLRILLPNDFDSLNLLAERISEWDKSVGSTLDAMATDVMSLVEQYSSVGSSAENIRGLGFSFLTGTDPGLPEPPFLLTKQIVRMTVETTGKKPMSSDAELQLWEQVLTLRKSLDDLATQGTTHGMIAQRTVDLSLGLATTDWLAQTRSLFVSKSLVKSMAEGRSKSASESAAIVWADVNRYCVLNYSFIRRNFINLFCSRTSIKNLVRDCEWILQAYQAQTSGEKELFPILSCFNAASLADDLEVDKSTSNRIALLETFFPGVADDLFSFDEDLGEDEDDGRGRTSRRAPAKRSLSPVNEDPVKSATKPSRSKKVSETVEIVAVEEDSGRASKSKRKANEPESKRLNVSKDQSKSGKRSRKDETALTENKDEEEEHNADEEEDDDDTKEAAKPISANFLTSLKRQVVSSLSSNDEQELVCQQLRQSFVGLVDFWYRLLHFLYLRLNETAIWDKKMRKLLQKGSELGTQAFGSSLSGDTASEGRDVKITPSLGIKLLAVHELYGQIESCLREAQARGLYSLQRLEVESNCLEITEYFRTVNDMFVKRQGLLKIPELLTFVKRGEGLLVLGEGICGFSVSQSKDNELSSTDEAADGMDVDEDKDGAEEVVESSNTFVRNPVGFFLSVAKLKLDLRTAKSWVTRFQAQSNAAGADALVAEASKLAVDLSEYLEIVQATVECYCFCRLGSHGQMIGCDLCAEWYHYSCVGITPVQAEKIEKYVCLRCNLRSMFNETARLAATLTNRWMRPSELAKHRDLRRNKAEKKRSKEEKDLAALERQTATLKDRRELVGAVLAANGEGEFPQLSELDVNQILTAGQAAQDAVDHQLTQLSIAITEVAQRVKRAVAEEEQVVRQIQMELSHRQAATEWMLAMQGVMWPSNREDLDIGRPISPHAIFPADESLSITFSAETLGMQDGLLSAGMLPAFEAAKVLRIDEIEDVREVFEAFRYMSWLNITLHCLRRPLPTYAYRLILRSAQSLSWADEKVIKAIALQLSRARFAT